MAISNFQKSLIRNYLITDLGDPSRRTNLQQITQIVQGLQNMEEIGVLRQFVLDTRETYIWQIRRRAIAKRIVEEFIIFLIPFGFALLAKSFTEGIINTVNLPEKPTNSIVTHPEIIAGVLGFLIMRKILQPYLEDITIETPAMIQLQNKVRAVEESILRKEIELRQVPFHLDCQRR